MAVVILEQRVAAIIVGIEALSVFRTFHSANFVKLDHCVIAAPGPNTRGVIFSPLPAALDYVVLDQAPITTPRLNAVTANIFQPVASNHHVQTGKPVAVTR